jgi:anthranilate phosphoribosyltransferase
VRTFINTSVKLVDPAGSRRAVVGIFHGPYHEPVAAARAALGVTRAAVVQAPGGLPEPSPDRPVKIGLVDGGAAASPSAWDGASALIPGVSAAPPPVCEGPAALATLLEAVMTTPETAPPGAVRMVILGAALLLWAAGLSPSLHDPGTLSQLAVALARHDAERTWRALATCYASW